LKGRKKAEFYLKTPSPAFISPLRASSISSSNHALSTLQNDSFSDILSWHSCPDYALRQVHQNSALLIRLLPAYRLINLPCLLYLTIFDSWIPILLSSLYPCWPSFQAKAMRSFYFEFALEYVPFLPFSG